MWKYYLIKIVVIFSLVGFGFFGLWYSITVSDFPVYGYPPIIIFGFGLPILLSSD